MMRALLLLGFLAICSYTHAQQWNWAVDAGGGGNTDFCYGIATDSEGNAYWVGSVSGTADFGCATLTPGSTIAGVLAKYDASGACQWVRGITTSFYDAWVYGIAIDAEDRVYITGSCQGTTDFGNGISLSGSGSSDDWFTARYDTGGNCIWARRIANSNGSSEGRGLALDEDGGLYVTGFAGGSGYSFGDVVVNNGSFTRQAVIVKYDSTGTAIWGRSTSGTTGGRTNARGIAVAGDRLFITGQVYFATTNYQGLEITSTNTTTHAFVLACDLQGEPLWARAYGGGDNEGFAIAADTLGNLWAVGRMWGNLHLPDDTLTSASDNDDILLLGLDQEGTYRWGKSTGSAQRDLAWGVTADGRGNAYVSAHFNNTIDFFGTPLTALGSEDAVICKVEADGDMAWVARPSGYQRDIPLCIHRQAVAPHKLFFGGYYFGPITYGGTTIDDNGNGDAMMVSGIDTTFDVSLVTTHTCPGICDGNVTAFVNGTGPFSFAWSNGATGDVITGLCPDTVEVVVTEDPGRTLMDTAQVAFFSDPGFAVNTLNDSLWITGGTAWQWSDDNGPITGADSASFVAPITGNYAAEVTDVHGCVWNSDTVLVVLNVGIGAVDGNLFSAYPNPVHDLLTVTLVRPSVQAAELLNSAGQRVRSFTLNAGVNTIDLNALATGPYLLRTADGRSRLVMKQ